MIAKSDLFILVVSASLLTAGILRWQNNISALNTASNTNSAQQRQSSAASNTTPVVAAQSAATSNALANSTDTTQVSAGALSVSAGASTSQVGVAASNLQAAGSSAAQTSAIAAPRADVVGEPNEPLYGVYVVKSGDFLIRIANAHGTSVETLRQINNINGSLISVGQEIKYPLPAN